MPKKKINTKLNAKSKKSELIEELRVGPEIIVEQQEIQQVSVDKQQKLKEHANTVLKPYQFTPGESGNPSGRPRDILKAIGLNIAHKKAKKILSKEELELIAHLGMNPEDVTVAESIMTLLATSSNKDKLELFLDRTFGKVPNININAEVSAALVTKFRSKFTDAELERIASGEDALELLLEKIPDVDDAIDEDDEEIIDASS